MGCLTQSNVTNVCCTDAMDFIRPNSIPSSQETTYANFVCDYRPLKPKKWRAPLLVGGDKLPYYDDAGSPAANLLECKILFNSVISHAHLRARFMTLDLKDFFLASPIHQPEFMKIPTNPDIFSKDNLRKDNLETKKKGISILQNQKSHVQP